MEEKTKQAIIDATFKLLERKDINSISVREIAVTAGVNVATISYYFGGKNQLFIYLMEQYWEDLIQLCEEMINKETITKEETIIFCKKYLAKEMSSTGIMRSEQIMYQSYNVDNLTMKRLYIQIEVFKKIVITFGSNLTNDTVIMAQTIALISALSQPAFWTDVATKFVRDLDSFIDVYVKELIERL